MIEPAVTVGRASHPIQAERLSTLAVEGHDDGVASWISNQRADLAIFAARPRSAFQVDGAASGKPQEWPHRFVATRIPES